MKTKLTKLFLEFFDNEQASGVVLILCTLVSIAIANSHFGDGVLKIWHTKVGYEANNIFLRYILLSSLLAGTTGFLVLNKWKSNEAA